MNVQEKCFPSYVLYKFYNRLRVVEQLRPNDKTSVLETLEEFGISVSPGGISNHGV